MEKFKSLLALLLIVFFTFSCTDDIEEDIKPVQVDDSTPANSDIQHFDEKNSTLINWDQLPEELKNAVPLDTSTSLSNARVESTSSLKLGPFGGNGGSPFKIVLPSGARIYAMALNSDGVIKRLIIWYKNGNTIYRRSTGSNGGNFYFFQFAANEYIYKVSGRSGWYVDRLKVFTNKKIFSIGGSGGHPFIAEVPSGYQILGFWGRSSSVIDQIGFYAYKR